MHAAWCGDINTKVACRLTDRHFPDLRKLSGKIGRGLGFFGDDMKLIVFAQFRQNDGKHLGMTIHGGSGSHRFRAHKNGTGRNDIFLATGRADPGAQHPQLGHIGRILDLVGIDHGFQGRIEKFQHLMIALGKQSAGLHRNIDMVFENPQGGSALLFIERDKRRVAVARNRRPGLGQAAQ